MSDKYGFATVKKEFTELFKVINEMKIDLENKIKEQELKFKVMEQEHKNKVDELNKLIDNIING